MGRKIIMKQAELFDIRGQVAFVTGAASGLGRAFAEVMADNGAHVVLTDIDATGVAAVAAELAARGGSVEHHVVDIGDDAVLKDAIDGTAARHGRLDTVFANAGISAGPGFEVTPNGELGNLDVATFRRVVDVNLTGNILTMQFAVRHMKPARRGSIVVNTSIGGLRAEPLVGYAYAASKSALHNVVRQAALELAPFNVRVNAIAPGPFLTNIAGGRLHTVPGAADQFAAMVPMGRLGQPSEIEALALLLAAPGGSFLTGTIIPIDGGAMVK
jgi:NAD(P)-dependent dehydrogenase (short-subunit alcohol dehydrogenase family)